MSTPVFMVLKITFRGGEDLKHGKRPTRAQKIRLKEVGLNWENWLVVGATKEGLDVVHKHSGKTRNIPVTLGKKTTAAKS